MRCNKCNYEINKENVSFCPQCGSKIICEGKDINGDIAPRVEENRNTEVSDNTDSNLSAKQEEELTSLNLTLPKVNFKITRKVKIGLALVVVLVCGFFAYKHFTAPLSAEKVATNFLNALKSENYDKAYSYLDDRTLIGEKFLTSADFKKAIGKTKVKDFRIINDIESFVKRDTDQWYNYENYLSSNPQAVDIIMKGTTFGEATFSDNMNVVQIKAEETWSSTSSSDSVLDWIYTLEKQTDGSWMVTGSERTN